MIRAHELIANLIPDSDEFKNCMSAVKFDLGELNDVYDLSDLSTGTVFEIPAPICLFQTTNMTDTNLFLAVQDCGGVVWKCFHKNINDGFRWIEEDCEFFINRDGSTQVVSRISDNFVYGEYKDDGSFVNFGFEKLPETTQWTLIQIINVAMSIEVFSCSNVLAVNNPPPKLINQKRLKKGKVPFFEYKTLHIKQEKVETNETKGGTHNSPRLHLRRGHIRKLSDGRKIWITACIVGNKEKGIVIKDYKVH